MDTLRYLDTQVSRDFFSKSAAKKSFHWGDFLEN